MKEMIPHILLILLVSSIILSPALPLMVAQEKRCAVERVVREPHVPSPKNEPYRRRGELLA